jgi:hypothetical protein
MRDGLFKRDNSMKRVIVYIDGFNLYYGLREKGWKWAYWLNLSALAQALIPDGYMLVRTKYFTSIVTSPPNKHDRQNEFLEALRTLPELDIFYGLFLDHPVTCPRCNLTYPVHGEKMTDVNIAVQALTDAHLNLYDRAILISADSDLTGMIRAVRNVYEKSVIVAFPPKRWSNELKQAANGIIHIGRTDLSKSLFPDEVIKPEGFILRRPKTWQ